MISLPDESLDLPGDLPGWKICIGYWMASWREGDRVRNVHLGSCMKMDAEAAMQKAMKIKAEALGMCELSR